MTSDGNGGVFIAWSDYRAALSFDPDIFMQHLRSDGTIDPGWPEGGFPVCTAPGAQWPAELVSDGQGGAYVGWLDYRDPPPDSAGAYGVYVQHMTPHGIAAGWPQDGKPVCPTSCAVAWLHLSEDGAGGAYLTWLSKVAPPPWSAADYAAFKVARIDADGAPAPGWPTAGLAVGDTVTAHHFRMTLPDGAGGLYLVSDRSSHSYLYHIGPDGSPAAGWPENGLDVSQRSSSGSCAAPDGDGGLFYFWSTFTYDGDPTAGVYAARVRSDGTPAPGWSDSGIRVSQLNATAPMHCASVPNGAIVTWIRWDSAGTTRVFAQKVDANGSIALGWPADGQSAGQVDSYLNEPVAASDGAGGAYVSWSSATSPQPGIRPRVNVLAQHVLVNGSLAEGWPAAGMRISPDSGQSMDPAIIPSVDGTGIVAWSAYLPPNRVLAQKLTSEGPESLSIEPMRSQARANRVRLRWKVLPLSDIQVLVFRSDADSPWSAIGSSEADASGLLEFEDSQVIPGKSYLYRVSLTVAGTEYLYGETAVDVPNLGLRIQLARPNPMRGTIAAEIELPTSMAAMVELIDVRGRRLESRELRTSGPGISQISFGTSRRLVSGVYFLRVTQEGTSATRRLVFIR